MAEIELAKAYVKIVPTTKGIKSEIENQLGQDVEGAGHSAGISFSNGFGKAMKGIGVALGATTAVAGKMISESISNYANYEQLIGGVETLFKGSSDQVVKYADEAFKTAGLSANEYMETVTGFSASLLQSVGGDTDVAAEKANRAIQDMSDNANKMGTSIESIQNAYQSFARGQYQLLDNLKLGYGGTKSEMERLLADATALSGIEYDIDSYADVIDAIGVIQDNLGITGTTAKEASTTISGSLNMMKASWQNLLTGMANGDADIGLLIQNLVESIKTFASNIIPVAEQALQGFSSIITQIAPIIAQELPTLVSSILPSLLSCGADILLSLAQGIIETIPSLVPVAVDIIFQLIDGIVAALPNLMTAAVDIILSLVDALTNPGSIERLISAALDIILTLAQGLVEALPQLANKIPVIIQRITEGLTASLPKILACGVQLIIALAQGLIKAIPTLVTSIPQIIVAITSGLYNGVKDITKVGGDLIDGLWEGIKNSWSKLLDNAKNLASDLVSQFKDLLKIGSPSKLMRDEVGKWIPAGIAVGIDANADSVTDAITEMNDNAMSASKSALGYYSEYGKNGYTPTVASNQNDTANLTDLLQKYLPLIADGGNVNVSLEGDANELFRMVRKQSRDYQMSTGQNAFA